MQGAEGAFAPPPLKYTTIRLPPLERNHEINHVQVNILCKSHWHVIIIVTLISWNDHEVMSIVTVWMYAPHMHHHQGRDGFCTFVHGQ